jgi:pimeloyl-ACP methyl ester carboxylesterase/class 3 adenylate cyclase
MEAETRYARSGDVHIAYQVLGDGPGDLVHVPGFVSQVEAWASVPEGTRFLRGLSSFSRLILFDKRGTGLSDRIAGKTLPSLGERIDEMRAVLDAVGSTRAALLGVSEGAGLAVFFAATFPERTSALILCNGSPLQPWGKNVDRDAILAGYERQFEEAWGSGVLVPMVAPSVVGNPRLERWMAHFERVSASRGGAVDLVKWACSVDVRAILPSVRVPTLVLHRTEDRVAPISAGRYFAKHIPGAVLKEHPGADHIPIFGDGDALVADIEEFLTGARSTRDPDSSLATILFTDIVSSPERTAELGDQGWRALLDQHDTAAALRAIAGHGGRLVRSTGAGVLAVFDDPARAVRSALEMGRDVAHLAVSLRAGLHIGDVQLRDADVGGMAVHASACIMSAARPGEVLVSSTVRDLLAGAGIALAERGVHTLKGVPGAWPLFAASLSA